MAVTTTTTSNHLTTSTTTTTSFSVCPPSSNVVSAENSLEGKVALIKKPAWNKNPILVTSSDDGEAAAGSSSSSCGDGGEGVVLGDKLLWPLLTDCTKSCVDSFKKPSQPIEIWKVSSTTTVKTEIHISSTTNMSPMTSPSSTSRKLTNSNSNKVSTSNHGQVTRQQLTKQGIGNNTQANGVSGHGNSPLAGKGARFHHNQGSTKPNSNNPPENSKAEKVSNHRSSPSTGKSGALSYHDRSPPNPNIGKSPEYTQADKGAHSHNKTSSKPNSGRSPENTGSKNLQNHSQSVPSRRNARDQPHRRNSFRQGNGTPQPRGSMSHQNYGARQSDQQCGYHGWNHQMGFNGRDSSMEQGVTRPPPYHPPVANHPPVNHFINPTMQPGMPVWFVYPPMQCGPQVPNLPPWDFELYHEILKQINYYFSIENLVKDIFLRRKMDENGWVHVDVISQFNMVKCFTTDTYKILEALRPSTVVEIQGGKIRRRDDWQRWIISPTVNLPIS